MRGSQQADSPSQKMGAIAQTRTPDPVCDRNATSDASPFAQIRLKHAERTAPDRAIEVLKPAQIFPSGVRHLIRPVEHLSRLPRTISDNQPLQTSHRRSSRAANQVKRRVKTPCLVGIRHDLLSGLQAGNDFVDNHRVTLLPEAGLALER